MFTANVVAGGTSTDLKSCRSPAVMGIVLPASTPSMSRHSPMASCVVCVCVCVCEARKVKEILTAHSCRHKHTELPKADQAHTHPSTPSSPHTQEGVAYLRADVPVCNGLDVDASRECGPECEEGIARDTRQIAQQLLGTEFALCYSTTTLGHHTPVRVLRLRVWE
jgi:hypothetical protein